ncbi:glucose/quinate/shikimate family membrane-bound PQQ-dependent dehydrogenase [Novosphingobium sp. ST904]|uniref:glucose/quinate/shikimate family membrane-bound PQQ-dependent dehydrogenase n=1 Tax=Novosphingobium sp. ST904 TaxID=1684385 RepID=UPI0006C8CDD2|nr:glucose/quinate/shikimate family membrane-bound PQQ-dependent dehydrogenase [Novosphingobium sp. ST904]KPH58194.1 quinate dehydrogenase [Novosphingobium sp. ST904]TCM41288.1 quinate dehydrogenase (quinone) [Novosphingobium sp. ST904]
MPGTKNDGSLLTRAWLWLLGAVVLLAGIFFTAGGAKLASLGGSFYFVIAGLALLVSGFLIARRRPAGALVFGATFLCTIVWALWEVGLSFWPLISRLLAMGVGATVIALSYPLLRGAVAGKRAWGPSLAIGGVLALCSASGFAAMFVAHPTVAFSGDMGGLVPVDAAHEQKNWEAYGNTSGGSRFVALDQINRDNVKDLKVAWTYRTGDVAVSDGNGAEDQNTPLQVGDTVFVCTPHNNVIALDADTGREKWKTIINAKASVWMRCRGLAYFDAKAPLRQPDVPGSTPVPAVTVAEGAPCLRRILMNTINAELVALDADTGKFCPDFGNGGRVDLKAGLGNAPDPQYQLTSAPTLAGTTVVVGGRVADNVQVDMPGGVMRGFDVVTGKLRWAFDPGNPAITGMPAAGKTYTRSTPNVWAAMSYDPATNAVIMPVGSASVDLYGVTRSALDHEYGASMLALDATTGKEKWHFQTVHNDLWDFDLPMQPSFIDFAKNGKTVPALVFGTKAGQLYVLDRTTGKPLTEVANVRVKAANIPNEPYSLVQPKSVGMPQIGVGPLTEADMWGATPFDQLMCRIAFKGMRYEGLYTAPGTDKSLSFPGSLGGMNWGGLSTDPTTGTIFANDMRLGLWVQMFPQTKEQAGKAGAAGEAVNTGMGSVPLKGTPYSVVKDRFLSALGVPCQAPPFGTLTAIDMKTRKIKWQVPVGTVRDTGPMGIKMGLPIPIGLPTLGGTLATQGGLVFIAGTQDYYLRAFNSANGKEIWKARLPVGSQGGPMSYKSPKTGKQYVVITAGGARQSPDRGDYVIAYKLP